MIAKLTKGRGFRGAVSYLLEGPRGATREHAHIIGGNMSGTCARQLAREFGVLRRLRPTVSKAVCHASISLSPKDRRLSDEELAFVARRFIVGMGFDACPFVVVRHDDTAHQHVHIVASRINTAGQVVSDAHDFKRAEKIMRDLEQVYMLRSPSESPHERKEGTDAVTKPEPQGANNMKQQIRTAVDEAIREAKSVSEFVKACRVRGVEVRPHLSGKRVCGLAFRKGELRVKGSALGRMYTWDALRQRLDYDDATDFPALAALAEEESEPLVCMVCPDITGVHDMRNETRRTLDEGYVNALRERFGADEVECQRIGNALEVRFKDGGRLLDYGTRIESDDTQPERLAKRMIAMALAKGWRSVSLSGGEVFLRNAMREAMSAGIQVVPKDAWQQAIQDEIKLSMAVLPESVAAAPPPLADIRARMEAMRKDYVTPAKGDEPKPRHRRFGM